MVTYTAKMERGSGRGGDAASDAERNREQNCPSVRRKICEGQKTEESMIFQRASLKLAGVEGVSTP